MYDFISFLIELIHLSTLFIMRMQLQQYLLLFLFILVSSLRYSECSWKCALYQFGNNKKVLLRTNTKHDKYRFVP